MFAAWATPSRRLSFTEALPGMAAVADVVTAVAVDAVVAKMRVADAVVAVDGTGMPILITAVDAAAATETAILTKVAAQAAQAPMEVALEIIQMMETMPTQGMSMEVVNLIRV